MRKIFQLAFGSLALFSLISCGSPHLESTSNSQIEPSSSVLEPVSSLASRIESSSVSSSSELSSVLSSSSIPVTYHVIFQNHDETVLEEVDVLEGSEAVYSGETPTKEEDDEFTYEFIGWDQDLKEIHSNITTTAQFKAVAKEGWGPIIWF